MNENDCCDKVAFYSNIYYDKFLKMKEDTLALVLYARRFPGRSDGLSFRRARTKL